MPVLIVLATLALVGVVLGVAGIARRDQRLAGFAAVTGLVLALGSVATWIGMLVLGFDAVSHATAEAKQALLAGYITTATRALVIGLPSATLVAVLSTVGLVRAGRTASEAGWAERDEPVEVWDPPATS